MIKSKINLDMAVQKTSFMIKKIHNMFFVKKKFFVL